MQLPLCEVCLNSSILCGGCQNKIDSGILSASEADIARTLFELSKTTRSMVDAEIIKIVDSDAIVIVVNKGDAAKVVGKEGKVVKHLAEKYKKSIRVVEKLDNIRNFAEYVLKPASISGVNTVYGKDGERLKIRLKNYERSRMKISDKAFSDIVKNIYNKRVDIEFE